MAKDIPSIPMFVRPVFTIAAKPLKGLDDPDDARGRLLERQHLDVVVDALQHVARRDEHQSRPRRHGGGGTNTKIGGERMLQYVIRRLLYSIVVLIAASMLVFTFVAKTGDPLAALRPNPRISQQSVQNIKDRKHLDDSDLEALRLLGKDAVTNGFGTTILGDKPILPDLWRVMKHTLQLVIIAELLAILIAVGIGVYSALRQYSVFDYSATTFSFIGLAMPVFWFALMLQVGVVLRLPSGPATTSSRSRA